MDETKLRQLERQYKLRVKTGCETCRKRRVKCDEAKPECTRCTKSGRRCEGYKHSAKAKDQSPAAAASFRNPSFLVVPQKSSRPTSVPRNPSRSLSPEAAENRSFYYFRTHTLPQWTEFFDSDLWSRKILQLSHIEPAIRHGILALSTLHERFENTTPILNAETNDFAFVQYMQAVTYSNELLAAHQEGRVDVEKVLIACVIFTCYENLAGNYRAANMHLRNGLRILGQHRRELLLRNGTEPVQESIANVLHRFDLQAMTFSDNTSPYDYSLDSPPECPTVPPRYATIAEARSDLVDLLRCMMWIAGVANINPRAAEDPTWLHIYHSLMVSFDAWEVVFNNYQQYVSKHATGDGKVHAGSQLLKMYAIMAKTIVAAGATQQTELAWDAFTDSFRTMVNLADTLPSLSRPITPPRSRSSSHSTPSPPKISPIPSPDPLKSMRPLAPHPATTNSASISPHLSPSPSPGYTGKPVSKKSPSSFTPSFELSPIVPLFVTACRCRDPTIRRRAIALLLNCRRREGVWDSYGAGMVALQVVKLEEEIPESVKVRADNWLPHNVKYTRASDVPESARVQDVFVSVNMAQRQVGANYLMTSGESFDKYVKF